CKSRYSIKACKHEEEERRKSITHSGNAIQAEHSKTLRGIPDIRNQHQQLDDARVRVFEQRKPSSR
ncbi:hypothetical protein L195_g063148, partial [Trifolium pratense]